jgi:hypothetical protein
LLGLIYLQRAAQKKKELEHSEHSSEYWPDEASDNSSDGETNLGKPRMEEDSELFEGKKYYDDDGNLVREQEDEIGEDAQVKEIREDSRFEDSRVKHANRFRAVRY